VLASYAVTRTNLEETRAGLGPRFIEALTYRMGAHTTSDDPTKYRDDKELDFWVHNDPISRLEAFMRKRGEGDAFFDEVKQEGEDMASDIRARTIALGSPPAASMFANVYSEAHDLMVEQLAWLENYEAAFEGSEA
jgi:2-oxoisovalerate dehydrogenase E1 component alpha subunit